MRHQIVVQRLLPGGPQLVAVEAKRSTVTLEPSGRLTAQLVGGRDRHGPVEALVFNGVLAYWRRPAKKRRR